MRRWPVDPRPFLLLIGAALGACSEPDQPAEVVISAATLSFDALTDTKQLSATVKNAKGADLTGAAVTWESSNDPVATVNGSGAVT
ncbi:MAG TPA: Ig-like domain-containing protein, partial [Gemmatimonadales bacterium]